MGELEYINLSEMISCMADSELLSIQPDDFIAQWDIINIPHLHFPFLGFSNLHLLHLLSSCLFLYFLLFYQPVLACYAMWTEPEDCMVAPDMLYNAVRVVFIA